MARIAKQKNVNSINKMQKLQFTQKNKSARHHRVSQKINWKVWFISSPNVDELLTFAHRYTQHKM